MANPETKAGIDDRADRPHPNDEVLVNLDALAVGTVVEVRTYNRTYVLEYRGSGRATITGHPQYCPKPVEITLLGAAPFVLRRGRSIVYWHPDFGWTRTSPIQDARQVVRTMHVGEQH
jgi:hypothetical protein